MASLQCSNRMNSCCWQEVNVAKLSADVKKTIGEIHPALVATAAGSGKPNVSAKGSLRVLDDEHLVFADIDSPRTIANIKRIRRLQ